MEAAVAIDAILAAHGERLIEWTGPGDPVTLCISHWIEPIRQLDDDAALSLLGFIPCLIIFEKGGEWPTITISNDAYPDQASMGMKLVKHE